MCGLEKVSHKNVIGFYYLTIFSYYSFACIIFFVTLPKDFKTAAI